jgi:DNA replication protein DnaC
MKTPSHTPQQVARAFQTLRLKGIADTFEDDYQKAAQESVSTIDFLGQLLDRELADRDQRRFERFLKQGDLHMTDCFENYDLELARAHGVKTQTVNDLIQGSFIGSSNVILAGAIGTGKTKLARTLAFECTRLGHRCIFNVTRDLVEELYRLRDAYHFPKVYRHYLKTDLLILDDLAYMPFDPDQVEFLFRLVYDRAEKKTGSLIVTTNTDVKEWWKFFPSEAMGMAFSDRVLGGAIGIKFTGESIRSNPPPNKKR